MRGPLGQQTATVSGPQFLLPEDDEGHRSNGPFGDHPAAGPGTWGWLREGGADPVLEAMGAPSRG
jgi:hypothetical protein